MRASVGPDSVEAAWPRRVRPLRGFAVNGEVRLAAQQGVFAAAAGLIFVPLTMTLVAGISGEHSGIASSMFNAGQQVGGAVGLAAVGGVTWTLINNQVQDSLQRLGAAPHAARALARPGGPLYNHALTDGVGAALALGAAAAVLALLVTLAAIRVRRADLPESLPAM
ncbi:MAG TPA: hypothetical protein VIV12_20205 [Streptosporangiaceae bacterium]